MDAERIAESQAAALTINDQRTTSERPAGYLICTDTFLSDWGEAPGRSLYALAFWDSRQADALEIAAKSRSDMARPRIVTTLKADGSPRVRLGEGDHLTIVDQGRAGEWYKGAAANWAS